MKRIPDNLKEFCKSIMINKLTKLKIPFSFEIHCAGRRDGSEVKSSCFSCGGPEFDSKYLKVGQLKTTYNSCFADLAPSSGCHEHTHTCAHMCTQTYK